MEKISLPTPPLLTHLVRNSHLLLNKLFPPIQKRIKTTIKALDVDEDGDKVKNHLQRVSMSLQRRKKETFPKSIAFTMGKRAIMRIGVLKKENKSQKTSDGLGDLHAGDCSYKKGGRG